MSARTGSFSAHGRTWHWRWLDARTDEDVPRAERLSVLTRDTLDMDGEGVDHTTWPEDSEVSAAVGRRVQFLDRGDDGNEMIMRAVPKLRVPCLVIGHGKAGRWSDDTSALTDEDADLWAEAKACKLLKCAHAAGYATVDGRLLQDAWLVVGKADTDDLDADPAVIAYCEAPQEK